VPRWLEEALYNMVALRVMEKQIPVEPWLKRISATEKRIVQEVLRARRYDGGAKRMQYRNDRVLV